MRRRRPRVTVLSLMVAVAVAGLPLGVEGLRRRSELYRARAALHRRYVAVNRAAIGSVAPEQAGPGAAAEEVRVAVADAEGFARRLVAYHQTLAAKYEAAAARPWRSIVPDPPPPEAPASFRWRRHPDLRGAPRGGAGNDPAATVPQGRGSAANGPGRRPRGGPAPISGIPGARRAGVGYSECNARPGPRCPVSVVTA